MPHMVALDHNGDSFDIEIIGGDNHGSHPGIDKQIEEIIANIQLENERHGLRNILLFVHGGLRSINTAKAQVTSLTKKIRGYNKNLQGEDRKYAYYPIFVTWESGMGEAYKDHLFRVRQGREAPRLGPFSAPAYFIADIGRAATRLPITYGYQGYNALHPTPVASREDIHRFNEEFYGKIQPYRHGIWLGEYNRSTYEVFADRITYAFPGVLKLITTPALDGIGVSAWDNMLRRTKTLFRRPSDYNVPKERKTVQVETFKTIDLDKLGFDTELTGGLSKLMMELRELNDKDQKGYPGYTMTLIGHSMGTIVLNELLNAFSDKEKDLPYNDIVYMAAACSINEFETAAIPYLLKNRDANFYNLTLHPVAEERERNYFVDEVPRGSLLVWIDDFAAKPATRGDLRLGKWNNAIAAWKFIPKDVRPRITLKGFGINDPETNKSVPRHDKPQKHGHFSDLDQGFWAPTYWRVPKTIR